MTNKKLSEFELIDKLTCNLPGYSKDVIVGVGDDCAVLKHTTSKHLLVTCDVQVAGVHFLLDVAKPDQIGEKAIAVNVSDIVAMGGKPTFCLVSLIIPKNMKSDYVDSIYDGIKKSCNLYNVQIIGGNISSGEQLVIDIFMMGEVQPDELLLRSGAKPGDKVLVTGSLGAAAAGLATKKHLIPRPRLLESAIIAESKLATSMIDISDGLLGDLGHICDESGVGVVVYEKQIPVLKRVTQVEKQLYRKPLSFALTGGEDYELLFTAPPNAVDKIIGAVKRKTGTPISVIGEVIPKSDGRWLSDNNGKKQRVNLTGWDHLKNNL